MFDFWSSDHCYAIAPTCACSMQQDRSVGKVLHAHSYLRYMTLSQNGTLPPKMLLSLFNAF